MLFRSGCEFVLERFPAVLPAAFLQCAHEGSCACWGASSVVLLMAGDLLVRERNAEGSESSSVLLFVCLPAERRVFCPLCRHADAGHARRAAKVFGLLFALLQHAGDPSNISDVLFPAQCCCRGCLYTHVHSGASRNFRLPLLHARGCLQREQRR